MIEPLASEHVDPCFVIARIALPWIDLVRWRKFVRDMLAARPDQRGLITVRRMRRRFPCGLAGYRFETDLRHDRLMVVRLLAAVDPFDNTLLIEGLAQRLVVIARETGCDAIRVVAADADVPMLAFGGFARDVASADERTFLL